ncbi:MAG TPA: mechanosensitive ion channel [Aeromonadales bacterium]|nr:mechanosensitive ion channel [Aeromonadales bacterium]
MEQRISSFLAKYGTTEYAFQLLALLASILIGWSIARLYESWFLKNKQTKDTLNRIHLRKLQGFRTIRRIVFPLTTALLIFVSSHILSLLKLPREVLDILMPLFLAMAAVRVLVYFMRAALPGARWLSTGESLISTLIWVTFALYSIGWLPFVVDTLDAIGVSIGDNKRLSLLGLIQLSLMLALLLLIAMWLSRQVEKRLRKSTVLDISMRVAVSKIFKFTIITVALLSALSSVGIDFTALTVFGGALGVGLGFGLQRIASNFVSGFILLFDRSIKPGDVISVGQNFGWVEELNARYIVVRNREGVETLIPNENLVTTEVINWSFNDKKVRLKIPVQISYEDDPEQAMEIMRQAAVQSDRVLAFPRPVCRLMEFGNYGINLELRVWISDPQNGVANVRSDINLAIWKAFKEEGITIPYPHQDIHFTNPLQINSIDPESN